jgi:hypothetical protein
VRFLEPVHEAWMQALDELFAGVSLAEASNIIDDDRIVDEVSGYRLKWKGYPMVLPVSAKLRERVAGEAYQERVAEVLAQLKLVVTEPVG